MVRLGKEENLFCLAMFEIPQQYVVIVGFPRQQQHLSQPLFGKMVEGQSARTRPRADCSTTGRLDLTFSPSLTQISSFQQPKTTISSLSVVPGPVFPALLIPEPRTTSDPSRQEFGEGNQLRWLPLAGMLKRLVTAGVT